MKAIATQKQTVKRKLNNNTLQASSLVALGLRIPTVSLHMAGLLGAAVEHLYYERYDKMF